MDSSNEPRCARKKVSKGEDRISNLSDSILGDILSRLPTKDAVCTSVLSKRWLYLWTFIDKLHFDDLPYSIKWMKKKEAEKEKCFVHFVYRVLLHLRSSSIESFRLLLSDPYDQSHVNAWISAILNRRVQILTIIHYPYALTIPSSHSLFSCESLVALELENSTVRVPSCIHLPNLKTLKLSQFKFNCDISSTSKDLILSFPVLKEYIVKYCAWSNVHKVILQVPLLEVAINKSNFVLHNCTFKFCASRLREFAYDGPPSQSFTLSHPSSALNASANINVRPPSHFEYKEEDEEDGTELKTGLHACKLLSQFRQVKFLRLDEPLVFSYAIDSFRNLPPFEMLRHLEVSDVIGKILIELLQKSPNLTTLDIKGVSKFDEELINSTIVPNCVIATLQVVKFGNLWNFDDELRLAKFVMENALVLERLSFSRS